MILWVKPPPAHYTCVAVDQNEKGFSLTVLEKCSVAVNNLMLYNGFSLNLDNSEVIVLATNQAVTSSNLKSIIIVSSTIIISETVKSIGVLLDASIFRWASCSEMSFTTFIYCV